MVTGCNQCWHESILKDREKAIAEGKDEFASWEEAKADFAHALGRPLNYMDLGFLGETMIMAFLFNIGSGREPSIKELAE